MSPTTASIRDRLLNRARAEGADFQLFLDRYPCERFLYRLGQSDLRERLILKGALCCPFGWMSHTGRLAILICSPWGRTTRTLSEV